MRLGPRLREFSLSDPWVVVTVVVVMIVAAFFMSRRLGGDNRLRFDLLHSLTDLGEEQSAFHQRHGYYAAHVSPTRSDSTVSVTDSSGGILVITHADSAGWTATGFNPHITGGIRSCYVYGGNAAHEPELKRPGIPVCW